MPRTCLRTVLFCLVIGFFVPATAPGDQAGLKRVTAVVTPYLAFAPYFIAQEEGFFEGQGLEVEFIRFTQSARTIPALMTGDVDVVAGTPFASYFNAISQGSNIRFVADRGHMPPTGCASQAVVVRKDLVADGTLEQPGWLKGRRLAATSPTSPGLFIINQLLEEQGLTIEDIEFISLSTPNRIQAFATDSIDITALPEPHLTRALDEGHTYVLKSAGQARPFFQQGVIAFGPNLLEKDPEAGQAFMTAYLQGVRQFMKGKTKRNVAIIARHTELEENLVRRLCWPTIRSDGEIYTQSVLDLQKWFHAQGLIDRIVSVEEFWDPRYTDYANNLLGKTQ